MHDAELQQRRLIAAAIDLAGLVVLSSVLSLMGVVLSCATAMAQVDLLSTYGPPLVVIAVSTACVVYVLGRDVLAGGTSPGKKLQGLRVVGAQGQPVTVLESAQRNLLFALGMLLSVVSGILELIPFLGCAIGCLLWPLRVAAALVSLGAVVWEVVQIVQEPNGVRLGDQLARTRVVRAQA